mmetsp:Transcript_18833/g.44120  ORF Transcript_18833/g.44120 Transcript_18833/m.44120 type:complete len:206 (-) Transcript_18833:351-968(-)
MDDSVPYPSSLSSSFASRRFDLEPFFDLRAGLDSSYSDEVPLEVSDSLSRSPSNDRSSSASLVLTCSSFFDLSFFLFLFFTGMASSSGSPSPFMRSESLCLISLPMGLGHFSHPNLFAIGRLTSPTVTRSLSSIPLYISSTALRISSSEGSKPPCCSFPCTVVAASSCDGSGCTVLSEDSGGFSCITSSAAGSITTSLSSSIPSS